MNDTTNSTTHEATNDADQPNLTGAGSRPDITNAEAEAQTQLDRDSSEQFQREAEQQEKESEAELHARLDMETEDDKAGKPLDTGVWGSTGHALADGVMQTLQNCGMSTDDAMDLLLDAAMTRDPGNVDQKALIAKIGPRRAKAVMEGLTTFSREMRPKDERLSNEVWQHTNGPHALNRLIEQASEKLPPAEVQGYLLQMAKGGSSAQRAVEKLQSIVTGKQIPIDRRVHIQQYGTPQPAPRGKAAASGLTSKEYVAAMTALHAPGSRLSFDARTRREAELGEARRIGRENGLR